MGNGRQDSLDTKETAELQRKSQIGVEANRLLDFAEERFLGPREKKIKDVIFAKVADGELTGDQAKAAWYQLHECYELMRELRRLKKHGIAAGETVEKSIERPH